MAVPAFIRLSDSGGPFDPGLRRVLEESFSVDLSGVRLHAGPRTAAFLRLHGYPAAAASPTMGIVSANDDKAGDEPYGDA